MSNKMRRILFVIPYYYPNIIGGAEISTQMIAEAFDTDEVDVLTVGLYDRMRMVNSIRVFEMRVPFLTKAWEKALANEQLSFKDKLSTNLMPLFPIPSLVKKYYRFIKHGGYDTVVFNANIEHNARASVWKAAKMAGARVILVVRDSLLLERRISRMDYSERYRNLIRKQMRWVDVLVSPSQYMLERYRSYGIFCDEHYVIPNAVQIPMRTDIDFDHKENVLYAGRVVKEKGILTLVEAMRMVGNSAELSVIGRGDLSPIIEGFDDVHYRSWMPQNELYAEMGRYKVIVLPSEWPEAFGRVLIEGVYSGTLVVGSNAGGIPEVLFNDGRYIFEQGNATDLADRIIRICNLSVTDYENELKSLRLKFERYSKDNYRANWKRVLIQ